MAYSIDKKTGEITISGFDKGTSPNQYQGMGKMLSVNLDTVGEVSTGYNLTLNTLGTGTFGIPIHKAINQVGGVASAYFILDATSQVWKATTYNGTFSFLSTSNVTTGGTATNQGLCYFVPRSGTANAYLFKFRNDSIDYLKGGTGTWVTGWKPSDGSSGATGIITASVNHFALEGQDSVLYFCNGAGIGSIMEQNGQVFDPTNPNTYSFTTEAVPIAAYDIAQSIAEQGTQLLIGGSLNAIYPWDRTSTQPSYPLYIGDTFIDRMVTVNTNVYIFAGGTMSRGRIYISNGSQITLFYKIPDYITGGGLASGVTIKAEQDPYFVWGDAMYHRNNLIFSFFMKKNGSGFITADTSFQSGSQIWALNLETTAFRSLSLLASSTQNARAGVIMPALQTAPGMAYIAGEEDANGSSSIQYSGTATGTGRYNVWADMIPVGTLFQKKTYSQLEFKLRTPLETGEDITIVPYVDGVFGTPITFNTVGIISGVTPVNFEQAQWLQLFIQANGASVTSGVRLYELIIR